MNSEYQTPPPILTLIVSLNIRCGSPSLPVARQCDDNQIRMCWFKFNVFFLYHYTLNRSSKWPLFWLTANDIEINFCPNMCILTD